MISCKRATELISKKMDQKISLQEELSLRLHLFICEFCERFRCQVKLIRQALNTETLDLHNKDQHRVPTAAKDRLKEKLKNP